MTTKRQFTDNDSICSACGHSKHHHAANEHSATCFTLVIKADKLTHRISINYPYTHSVLACACPGFAD
jgi:uncharacterized protein (DUF983 family)